MKRSSVVGLGIGTLLVVATWLIVGCTNTGAKHYVMHDSSASRAAGTASPARSMARRSIGGKVGGLATAVAPGEEVWVIARMEASSDSGPPASEVSDHYTSSGGDGPTEGQLLCRDPDQGDREVPLPLEHTDVEGAISGYIASVTVTQQFNNPYDGKIEAVYVFPLPQNAAVNEFVMVIGERRIRGLIRERQEAEQIYKEARRQGYTASLLTQERPNVFTQKVANIEPGKRIDVEITYFNTLAYSDGWYEFVFPMVVGPRFNAGSSRRTAKGGSTDGIGAVPRGASGSSGQATEVSYLAPGERSGHDIDLRLEIDAGVPIEEIASTSHVVDIAAENSSRTVVRLARHDRLPNKDFVLRYRVAGDEPKASMMTHRDQRGGFFTLMVYPPREIVHQQRAPIEMVFVVDCSGSMKGEPIAKARRAIERSLRQLEPDDTFQIIRFSSDASSLGPRPLPATSGNVRKGLRFVKTLKATGGTMMIRGIRAALDFPEDPERVRYVTFMTDGFIGNETEILGEVERKLGDSRIFSFGVGSSPNRYLLERLAKVGRGVVAYLGLDSDPNEVMDLFIERVRHPAMSELAIDFGSLTVDRTHPERLPDLFVGRPVILTGRFEGPAGEATVRIAGRAGDERLEIPIRVDVDDPATTHTALPAVWARMQIADLADRATYDPDVEIEDRIRELALEYGLMSSYTAFLAVDSSQRTEGEFGTSVPVAVPVPDGVRYDTTVRN